MDLKKRFQKIPSFLRNKFVIGVVLFVAWLLFVDRNSAFTQYSLSAEENKLEGQKAFYKQEIDRARQDQYELLSSPEKLEKFAREQYRMKKDDEDLFIITNPKPKID
ncbi:septum formation initiator family protein [Chitinophaga sp. SYP-B3965]|uniref:FtsB family cell division protein n=1 Tax=Chitinophaga sp. SYP-B3965 TaxID=2663120 RepID=UPI0012995252|nr:septum formation initiator family protein [Chitinophaga sp. SYP-B3965]MRG48684.1 septum formation initiator family protein [Chitinophaga sp. SYP-B3965]